MNDALRIAKTIAPAARVRYAPGGEANNMIPTIAPDETSHPLEATAQRENTPGVIVSPYPGMRGRRQEPGLDPSVQPDDALTKWTPGTPNLIGAPVPPPIQHPLHAEPRHEKISRVASDIFKSPGFQDLAYAITGLRGIKAVPIHGMYEGNREPSFAFQHPNMTKEASQKLANLLGFGFGQDSTVRVDHDAHASQVTPAMLIGSGNVLNKRQIDAIMEHAKNEGLDGASSTEDGRAVKFLHFGGEENLPGFIDQVNRVADKSGMQHRLMAHANTELVNNEDYVKNLFGENREGERGPDGKPQPSDLFKRTVDHVLAPYAKGIAGEGFRLSPERLAQSHNLLPHEEDYIRNALYPTGKKSEDRTTIPLMEGKEPLDVRPTGHNGASTVDDVLFALQNRAGKKGMIDPEDRSDKARDLIANDMAREVEYHMNHSDKSAIGWYDDALKKAMSHYYKIFPELATDPEKAMQFKAILGITSQGNNVFENSTYAARMYDLIRNGATMPEAIKKLKGSFGNQTDAIEQNLQKYHHLLDKNGFDRMSKLFNTKMTVAEWKKLFGSDPTLFGPNGKPLGSVIKGKADQKVTGWSVFGPKIGSFINNLHGDYSTLTADLWFSRTWNRLLGHNFIHNPETESGQLQNFKDALKAEYLKNNNPLQFQQMPKKIENGKVTDKPWLHGDDTKGMSPEEYDRLINDPDALLAKAQELENLYRKGGYKDKSDLRRRAKNWIQNREQSVAAPRGDTERNFQQQTAERAQQILKKKTGKDISVADIQAALWFHEKELFAKYGVASEKAKPADYEDAAKRAVEQYHLGDLHKVKSTGKQYGVRFDEEEPEHEATGGVVRRAYKKGGKVEGAIWHEKDAYGDGGEIPNPMSVFPKPQRMFPEDAPVFGGQYLSMPDKADMTGHKSAAASIGVHPGGKPYFIASRDAVDETGTPGRGSATAKTNLFKQKAGWKWKDAPEGHEDTNTVVSVEHRGQHHYALNAHFPKGVDFARYENSPSEPRLRPTTKGNIEFGPQAGSILVRGREHPVYHHVIVKNEGGEVAQKAPIAKSKLQIHDPAIVEHVLAKVGAVPPALDPSLVAKRGRPL